MRDTYRGSSYGGLSGSSRWAGRSRGRGARGGRSYPYPTSAAKPGAEPCAIYTRTGRCDQGPSCRYRHDPDHVALCQAYFMTGRCSTAGNARCFMSHKPQPQNTPMCLHYARGRCDKSDCKFTHMTNLGEDPNSVEVCRKFAMVGWCEKGAACTRRHAFDCPDFDAHGKCNNPGCKLQHVIKSQRPRPAEPLSSVQTAVNLESFIEFLQKVDSGQSFAASRALTGSEEVHTEEATALDAGGSEHSDADSDTEPIQLDFVESMNAAHENHESIDVNADFVKV